MRDDSFSSTSDAQAVCDGYTLSDQNGQALTTRFTARHNTEYFQNHTLCDWPFNDGQGLGMAALNDASSSGVLGPMRYPHVEIQSVAVAFPGSTPVGRSGNGVRMAVFYDSGCRGPGVDSGQACQVILQAKALIGCFLFLDGTETPVKATVS